MAVVAGEPLFVVVGTGRHGSKYVAALLSAAGIPTGHEAWWGHAGLQHPGLLGDSTWFAVPHLADYPGKVFHQVRDPLLVVNSLLKSPERGPADEARRRALNLRGDVVEQAVTITLAWRRMCDALPLAGRWRLEDVGPDTVAAVAANVGLGAAQAAHAVATTPRDVNHHGQAAYTYGWDNLPMGPETRELMRAAERDGYL